MPGRRHLTQMGLLPQELLTEILRLTKRDYNSWESTRELSLSDPLPLEASRIIPWYRLAQRVQATLVRWVRPKGNRGPAASTRRASRARSRGRGFYGVRSLTRPTPRAALCNCHPSRGQQSSARPLIILDGTLVCGMGGQRAGQRKKPGLLLLLMLVVGGRLRPGHISIKLWRWPCCRVGVKCYFVCKCSV